MRNVDHSIATEESRQTILEHDMAVDPIATVDFLNHLFYDLPDGLFVEFTFIAPPGVSLRPHIVTLSYKLGEQEPEWERFAAANELGYGVYYAVTPKLTTPPRRQRSTERNTACCQALWVDIDSLDKDAAYTAICNIYPPATVIINSGGGLHGLWRIAPIEVNPDTAPAIKQTLRGLALATGGDTSVAELARVLRLPNTVNTKPERNGARCKVISWIPGECLFEDFADFRALAMPDTVPLQREFNRHKPDNEPGYLTWYLEQRHPSGQRNNSLNWVAYKMHSDGYTQTEAEAALLAHALGDGLEERAILRTIASAFSATPGEPSYVSRSERLRMAAREAVLRASGGAK